MESNIQPILQKIKESQNQTIGLIFKQHEIQKYKDLIGQNYNEEFKNDLNLQNYQWIYFENKRCLLLQLKQDVKKAYQQLGIIAVQQFQQKKLDNVDIFISEEIDTSIMGVFYNSFTLSNYEYSLKTKKQDQQQEQDERLQKINKSISNYKIDLDITQFENQFWLIVSKSTLIARDLANSRGSIANPDYMQQQVEQLLKDRMSNIKEIQIIKGDELEKKGMNLFYNVGKGAVSEPRCIVINYQGNKQSEEIEYALVGKGITFDTGGLNLKPTGGIEDMYLDKGGACAVIGSLIGAIDLNLEVNVVFILGLAENTIGSKVYLPSDIIKSLKGLTVEITNTDFEGRLVLADAMTFAQQQYKPKNIIDIATLTGSIRVALGQETAGLYSNDKNLSDLIKKAGEFCFEKFWEMPIDDEARENMRGTAADLNNKGRSLFGSANQAAAFLEAFIEKGVKWTHLDIAGPGIMSAQNMPLCQKGTGFGTQTLLRVLANNKF